MAGEGNEIEKYDLKNKIGQTKSFVVKSPPQTICWPLAST